jgi:hypothetical protein
MLANDDFYQEFLIALNAHKVRYMIFGGFAVNLYGFTRVTEALDIWIDPGSDNLGQLKTALVSLGFTEEDHLRSFIEGSSIMLRLTDDAFRIDLLTKLNIPKDFNNAIDAAEVVTVAYGKIYFLGYTDLIDEKSRAKRPKDLIDINQLREIRGE